MTLDPIKVSDLISVQATASVDYMTAGLISKTIRQRVCFGLLSSDDR